ncbi:MAG: hypothetical protein ACRCX2_18480 [Paraclostridium sp.]
MVERNSHSNEANNYESINNVVNYDDNNRYADEIKNVSERESNHCIIQEYELPQKTQNIIVTDEPI